ncbi:MAG: argininosuccinate lyase [Sulfolobaceae archaeon]
MIYRKWGSNKDFVIKYTSSLDSDKYIIEEVKLVMKVHVIELFLSKYIDENVASSIIKSINSFTMDEKGEFEDIHEALEAYILKQLGEVGGWIGLGRSRNDHVATALRIKMRNEIIDILEKMLNFRKNIISNAEANLETIIPSFTHFQPAQPTTLAHYFLYIEEELSSRWETLFSILKLVNRSPLGSGAIVGSNIALNRLREAEMLGFESIIENTLYATSTRSDLISAVNEMCLTLVSLSRIAEDLILLSSKFVGILMLPDTHVSTSSLMPQKRNAVTMEILRSKAGVCIGIVSTLLSVYKSLPSGYNLDLQELNSYYWKITEDLKDAIEVLNDILLGLKVLKEYDDKEFLSTDVAEIRSVREGKPYRKIYNEIVEKIRAGVFIAEMSPLDSIKLKKVEGSPNPEFLKISIKNASKRVEDHENMLKSYKERIQLGLAQLRAIENELM